MKKISELINKIVGDKVDNSIQKLKNDWNDIFEDDIIKETEPIFLVNKKLYLKCESSVWIQELIFKRDEIKMKINKYYKKEMVSELSIRQG